MIGYIADTNKNLSTFQPPQDVADLTALVKKDYNEGDRILNKSWTELNNRSVIEDANRGQMMFNAHVDTEAEDPNEAWKWRGTRSKARNKGIAMHANLTANFLVPLFQAQNERDEVDEGFSDVMRDLAEWVAQPNVSDYQQGFMGVTFGMLYNPVTYLGADFCRAYQVIKEKKGSGYAKKYILDEVLSGYKAPVWGPSEVLITNAFERNIQRQKAIIKRRYAEKSTLEAKWGEHPNWQYVQSGIKSIYSEEQGVFYDIKDDDHPNLVAEETYLCRQSDLEVTYLNGIYMGSTDVSYNPIKHRDNLGTPRYNVIPFGYSRIGDHFFYYKSMMNALQWDNMLYDAMSEIVMNRSLLEIEVPIAISGTDKIDTSVIFPNSVVPLSDKDSKVSRLLPENSNLAAGFQALKEIEQTLEEGSVSKTTQGQLPEASQKAYSVAQAASQAKKLIGSVGKSLAESLVQYGELMKDIILNHITIPQVEEITGGGTKLKYRQFFLQKKGYSKKIVFDESLIGRKYSEKEIKFKLAELLEESGYPYKENSIYVANPQLFPKFKYLCKIDIEEMFVKNAEYWQAILPGLYTMLREDPLADSKFLLSELSKSYFNDDKLVKKGAIEFPMGAELPPSQISQIAEGSRLKSAAVEASVV